MKVIRVVRESLRLLSRRDQCLLGIITLAQMATGFLDLAGVLLLGLVSVISVSAVSGTAMPAQMETFVERFGWSDVDPVTLSAWLFGIAALALIIKSIVSMVLARRTFRFLAHRQATLSARLTKDLLSCSLLDIQSRASQDVAFIITVGTQAAIVGVLGAAATAVADITLLVVLGLGLTAIDPLVTVFSAVYFAVIALVLQRSLSRWASSLGEIAADVDIASYTAIQEALSCYREIMVANRRSAYVNRIEQLRWKSADVGADSQFVGLIPKYVFEIALVVGGVALALSQAATKDLAAAVGIVAVFLVAGSRIMPALLRLQVTALTIRRAEAASAKAYGLAQEFDASPEVLRVRGRVDDYTSHMSVERPGFEPTIQVEDVWLTYPGSCTPAVRGVSFSAQAGDSIALVGSTGAGKSTLADLVLGVVDPDCGTVRLGGLHPAEAVAAWPGGVAYVPQEVALVNGTVRDNVALGLPHGSFDDFQVWEALEAAHLADYLRDFREGLETRIGEGGVRLSGGQRQRLGLARALLTRPGMVVLDEATSALDAETEQAIATTMRDLQGKVTTLTIAHRLATVRDSTLVIYLEAGEVGARGSFDEVRSQSATFDHQAQLLGL